jgi:hypothetical protein
MGNRKRGKPICDFNTAATIKTDETSASTNVCSGAQCLFSSVTGFGVFIIMGSTTRIATGGTTTDITMADTSICTGVGLRAFMLALAIIAIGKES